MKKINQSNKKERPRIIKKYGSRRLYDTSQSNYINFKELGEIIANGFEIKVIDAKTKEDLTQQTIVSYCIENLNILDFCSIEILKMIIKTQSYSAEQKALVANFFEKYFKYPS